MNQSAPHNIHDPEERLTPALILRLGDTARESRRGHETVACIASSGRLSDDELTQRNTRGSDLEERSLWPGGARSGKKTGAGGVLGGPLYKIREACIVRIMRLDGGR